MSEQLNKEWVPYKGPDGGEGWQRTSDGEVRYQKNPPGEVADGHDADHWGEGSERPEMSDFAFYINPDGGNEDFNEMYSVLEDIFTTGEFDGGNVTGDVRPIDDDDYSDTWDLDGETPETGNATGYGYIETNVEMPVEDFASLQEYIGAELSSWESRDDFWDETNPERIESLKEGLTGESVEEYYDGVPIPYIKIGSDGSLMSTQEGRHRTQAARELGLDKIPFKVMIDPDEEGKGNVATKGVAKNGKWVPYQGPYGGEGWQNLETGEVVYEDDPPGEVAIDEDVPADGYPQRWGDWDTESATPSDGGPDNTDIDGPDIEDTREAIVWSNLRQGDRVAFRDENGERIVGEVTEVAQDGYSEGHVWIDPDNGDKEIDVMESDFVGDARSSMWDSTVEANDPDPAWFTSNTFMGQEIKVYDNEEGRYRYATVRDIGTSDGTVHELEVKFDDDNSVYGHEDLDGSSDRYDIEAAEAWDGLSRDEQLDKIQSTYNKNTSLTQIDSDTRSKVNEQMWHDVIPSFRDTDIARRTFNSFFLIRNRVDRASCSGIGGFSIRFEDDAPEATTHHEMGHGVGSAYHYNYKSGYSRHDYSDEKYRRRPTNMSHDYSDLSDFDGNIDYDFSEDSNFFAPVDYMLRDARSYTDTEVAPDEIGAGDTVSVDVNGAEREIGINDVSDMSPDAETKWAWRPDVSGGSLPTKYYVDEDGSLYEYDSDTGYHAIGKLNGRVEDRDPPGYAEWKEQAEGRDPQAVEYDLSDREWEERDNSETAEIFESLEPGDAVRLHVGRSSYGTDEVDWSYEEMVFTGDRGVNEEGVSIRFKEPSGSEWSWSADRETGELDSSRSELVGVSRATDDWDEDDTEPETVYGHFEGFIEDPETSEEKMENLISAANRAWYRQAKTMEESDDAFEQMDYHIGSGYSATNAHETLAQMHQVMQSPKAESFAIGKVCQKYPYLVKAYKDIFNLSDNAKSAILENEIYRDELAEYGIEVGQ